MVIIHSIQSIELLVSVCYWMQRASSGLARRIRCKRISLMGFNYRSTRQNYESWHCMFGETMKGSSFNIALDINASINKISKKKLERLRPVSGNVEPRRNIMSWVWFADGNWTQLNRSTIKYRTRLMFCVGKIRQNLYIIDTYDSGKLTWCHWHYNHCIFPTLKFRKAVQFQSCILSLPFW